MPYTEKLCLFLYTTIKLNALVCNCSFPFQFWLCLSIFIEFNSLGNKHSFFFPFLVEWNSLLVCVMVQKFSPFWLVCGRIRFLEIFFRKFLIKFRLVMNIICVERSINVTVFTISC